MHRHRIPILLMLCVALCWTHARAEEWYQLYEKGKEAVERQQWDQAITYLSEAIGKKDEESAKARTYGVTFVDYFPYLYRAVAYYNTGKYDLAERDLQKSEQFGEVKEARDDTGAAGLLDRYKKLLGNRPQIAEKFNEAIGYYNKKEYQKAIDGFGAVLQLDPNHIEAKQYLAKAKEEANKPPPIAEDKGKNNKERIDQELRAGIDAFNKKNYPTAKDHFKAVLTLDKSNVEAANYLQKITDETQRIDLLKRTFADGMQLFNEGDLDGAQSKMQAVLKLDNTYADAKTYLKRINDKRAEAEAAYKQGVAFFNKKDMGSAEAKFTEAIAIDQGLREAREYLTRIRNSRGVAATEQHADSVVQLARQLFDAGRLKQAKGTFLAARSLGADVSSYLNRIDDIETKGRDGIIAYFKGQYDESIRQLSEATSIPNKNKAIYAVLACAYGAKYFLTGAEDEELQQKAIDTYKTVRNLDEQYRLDSRYISPKIIALFPTQ